MFELLKSMKMGGKYSRFESVTTAPPHTQQKYLNHRFSNLAVSMMLSLLIM